MKVMNANSTFSKLSSKITVPFSDLTTVTSFRSPKAQLTTPRWPWQTAVLTGGTYLPEQKSLCSKPPARRARPPRVAGARWFSSLAYRCSSTQDVGFMGEKDGKGTAQHQIGSY